MQASSRVYFIIAIRSAFIKKENKQKFSLIALIVLTLIILTLGKYNFKAVDYIKIFLREIAYRSSFVVSIPENLIVKTYHSTKEHFFIYDDNRKLRAQLDIQLAKNYKTEYIIAENKRLKSVLDSLEYSSDKILAKVLIDKKSPFLRSIIVNKGSRNNVKLGMAAMDGEYLVGKVVEVSFSTSRILLLSDLNSKIPVDIVPGNIQSILSGTGEDDGIIQYTKQQQFIENESKVFTSGAGEIFKAGIPIGEVKKNNDNSNIKINFFSDISQLRFLKLNSYKTEKINE